MNNSTCQIESHTSKVISVAQTGRILGIFALLFSFFPTAQAVSEELFSEEETLAGVFEQVEDSPTQDVGFNKRRVTSLRQGESTKGEKAGLPPLKVDASEGVTCSGSVCMLPPAHKAVDVEPSPIAPVGAIATTLLSRTPLGKDDSESENIIPSAVIEKAIRSLAFIGSSETPYPGLDSDLASSNRADANKEKNSDLNGYGREEHNALSVMASVSYTDSFNALRQRQTLGMVLEKIEADIYAEDSRSLSSQDSKMKETPLQIPSQLGIQYAKSRSDKDGKLFDAEALPAVVAPRDPQKGYSAAELLEYVAQKGAVGVNASRGNFSMGVNYSEDYDSTAYPHGVSSSLRWKF